MNWSTNGYNNFVVEVNKLGVKNFCSKYRLSHQVITAYIKHQRTPNYMSRKAIAALVGIPLNSFD